MFRKSLIIGIALCAFVPMAVWAGASYYEASGQTVAFTLSAGSTAGWNVNAINPIITTQKISKGVFALASINAAGGALRIAFSGKIPANAVVSVYNLKGSKVAGAPVTGANLVVGRGMANGAYVVRVAANGVVLVTSQITVVR